MIHSDTPSPMGGTIYWLYCKPQQNHGDPALKIFVMMRSSKITCLVWDSYKPLLLRRRPRPRRTFFFKPYHPPSSSLYRHSVIISEVILLVGAFNPFEKYAPQIGNLPPGMDENEKIFKNHHLVLRYLTLQLPTSNCQPECNLSSLPYRVSPP